ncbi:MAG: hypothetical protein JO251_09840 [Verrucomicrobia bacterium]|nr:hypothetical protein [Verrucomicrobiota bacterium]
MEAVNLAELEVRLLLEQGKMRASCLQQILFEAGKGRWRQALAIGLAALGMAAAPMTARAEAGSEADWKASLNQAWEQLSTRQQQELDQEEHEWIKWKNRLSDDDRYHATKDRYRYVYQLAHLETGQNPAQIRASMLADASNQVKELWNELSPDQQQQIREPVNNYTQQFQNVAWYIKLQALSSLANQLAHYQRLSTWWSGAMHPTGPSSWQR